MNVSHIYSTDTDSKAIPGFLLGVIVALSVLFVALEFTSVTTPDVPDDSFDDMVQDMDLQSYADQRDMISADRPAVAASANIKAVEAPQTATPDKLAAQATPVTPGDEVAVTDDAHVSQALPQTPVDDKPVHFRVVEQIPQFEGGMEAFTKWLTQNLSYPPLARQQHIEGRVVVSFIINRDGSISSPKIEHSVHPLLDREALRVIKQMPPWKPGMENDKPCRTLFAIPIVFQL